MNIPAHIQQRSLSATQSKETAALMKNVQQGQPSLTQKVLTEANKNISHAATQIGWAPLLAMTFVYANRIAQQDQARKTKPRFLGIEI